MTTVSDILNQLVSGMDVDDIRSLVNTWNMDVGGGTLILYSGGVGEINNEGVRDYSTRTIAELLSNSSDTGSGRTVKTIADTGISNLFNDGDFVYALEVAIANDTSGKYTGRADDAGACNFDGLAGQPYAAELFGDVGARPIRVLTPETEISMEDHVAGRINVLVEGDEQIIIAVACE